MNPFAAQSEYPYAKSNLSRVRKRTDVRTGLYKSSSNTPDDILHLLFRKHDDAGALPPVTAESRTYAAFPGDITVDPPEICQSSHTHGPNAHLPSPAVIIGAPFAAESLRTKIYLAKLFRVVLSTALALLRNPAASTDMIICRQTLLLRTGSYT